MASTEAVRIEIGDVVGSHVAALPGEYSAAASLVLTMLADTTELERGPHDYHYAWFCLEDSIDGEAWSPVETTSGSVYFGAWPSNPTHGRYGLLSASARYVVPVGAQLRLVVWNDDNAPTAAGSPRLEDGLIRHVRGALLVRRFSDRP